MICMVPDDANNVVHLATTMFYMAENMMWTLGWVRNKRNSF